MNKTRNLQFMLGGEVFYPAWDHTVFLTGLTWPILITFFASLIPCFRGAGLNPKQAIINQYK